jgi:hypothetical protein
MELHPWWLQKNYYHKGTWHNTYYWDLIVEECDKHHLPRQFSEDQLKFSKESEMSMLHHMWETYKLMVMDYIANQEKIHMKKISLHLAH